MTFSEAIKDAPESADFIAYTTLAGGVTFLLRRSDGVWDSVASATSVGTDLMAAGIAARGQSLWNADTRQFVSGTVAQMIKGA